MKTVVKLSLIGSILFFASCNNSADTKTDNADTAAVETEETSSVSVNEEFPRLFTYLQSQDSSFSPDKFEGGEMDTEGFFVQGENRYGSAKAIQTLSDL